MEAVNGGGPPPPSPLTGCYLLIVVGEPHSNEHKDTILQRVAKGLLSWDVNDCLVDLEKELAVITEQGLEGEEARYGERLIQFASENLVTEILIHPVVSTLAQCVRNLLSSFTRHRHIIHAGYTFSNNGSWILQDGTFSYADFCEALQEIEVLRVVRAYENGISLDVHCAPEGDWTRLPKEHFVKGCNVRLNPTDVLTAGSKAISNFKNYLEPFLVPAELEDVLECSDVVGNIRFSRPTLYVFPGGQGDAALFGINGFNMLLDGGFSRKACFWDFVRHLDRLDAVLLTRLNNSNVSGVSSVLGRKRQNAVYPQIGHFFCNIQERKAILSPDGDKDKDPLLVNLLDEGQDIVSNLKHLNLTPQVCYRDSEPINLYHKVGHGTLDMYVLSPAKESKEVKEFLHRWNCNDQKLFASHRSKEFIFPLQNLVSICSLLVWQPANSEDTITRILFPGSSPQSKIFEGLDRMKNLDFIKQPVCSEKSLAKPTKQSVLERILAHEKKKENDVHVNGVEKVKKSDSTESEKSVTKKKVEKPKPDLKPKRNDSQQRKVKTAEKKQPSPPTPKKTVNGEVKPKPKASPTATPAKSAKEANNRKVLESKSNKTAPKKEPEKKIERKPISRRPKESPVKKVNGQKPDSLPKKGKLDKEGTTDSSTVSTPSADQDSILKKDISKLTPEELQKLKAQELKEEQEAVKEIEAVFRKSEQNQEQGSDFRKIKDLSIESEEYLIVEKIEDTQKIARDSEESEKKVEAKPEAETSSPEKETEIKDEKGSTNIESGATTTAPTLPEDERMPLDEIKEDNDQVEEKHVKEDTKEKDPPVHTPPKTFENIAKLPPVVGIRLDKQSHMRDVVKTPDEVADLPVHEEVDIDHFDYDAKEKSPDEVGKTAQGEKEPTVILEDLNKKELSKPADEEKDTDDQEPEKDKSKTMEEVKADVSVLHKIDEKLQKLKDDREKTTEIKLDHKVEAPPQHAEPVVIAADSQPDSPEEEGKKMDLGRKSPKEREEDVVKIVATVAEVLKSDAPLEEFHGKLPIELRETHITTIESPVKDEKTLTALFLDGERTIAPIEEAKEEPVVHRMLVTASSEDGGEEIEICPPGTITFSKSSESSGRSSPEVAKASQKSSVSDATVKHLTKDLTKTESGKENTKSVIEEAVCDSSSQPSLDIVGDKGVVLEDVRGATTKPVEVIKEKFEDVKSEVAEDLKEQEREEEKLLEQSGEAVTDVTKSVTKDKLEDLKSEELKETKDNITNLSKSVLLEEEKKEEDKLLGQSGEAVTDVTKSVTKDKLEDLKSEIKEELKETKDNITNLSKSVLLEEEKKEEDKLLGQSGEAVTDVTKSVTKDKLEDLKSEIKEELKEAKDNITSSPKSVALEEAGKKEEKLLEQSGDAVIKDLKSEIKEQLKETNSSKSVVLEREGEKNEILLEQSCETITKDNLEDQKFENKGELKETEDNITSSSQLLEQGKSEDLKSEIKEELKETKDNITSSSKTVASEEEGKKEEKSLEQSREAVTKDKLEDLKSEIKEELKETKCDITSSSKPVVLEKEMKKEEKVLEQSEEAVTKDKLEDLKTEIKEELKETKGSITSSSKSVALDEEGKKEEKLLEQSHEAVAKSNLEDEKSGIKAELQEAKDNIKDFSKHLFEELKDSFKEVTHDIKEALASDENEHEKELKGTQKEPKYVLIESKTVINDAKLDVLEENGRSRDVEEDLKSDFQDAKEASKEVLSKIEDSIKEVAQEIHEAIIGDNHEKKTKEEDDLKEIKDLSKQMAHKQSEKEKEEPKEIKDDALKISNQLLEETNDSVKELFKQSQEDIRKEASKETVEENKNSVSEDKKDPVFSKVIIGDFKEVKEETLESHRQILEEFRDPVKPTDERDIKEIPEHFVIKEEKSLESHQQILEEIKDEKGVREEIEDLKDSITKTVKGGVAEVGEKHVISKETIEELKDVKHTILESPKKLLENIEDSLEGENGKDVKEENKGIKEPENQFVASKETVKDLDEEKDKTLEPPKQILEEIIEEINDKTAKESKNFSDDKKEATEESRILEQIKNSPKEIVCEKDVKVQEGIEPSTEIDDKPEKYDLYNGLEKVEQMVVDVITADREEAAAGATRKESKGIIEDIEGIIEKGVEEIKDFVFGDTKRKEEVLEKSGQDIEKNYDLVSDMAKSVVFEKIGDEKLSEEERKKEEKFLEKSGKDIEEKFDVVSDMTKSTVFEKCEKLTDTQKEERVLEKAAKDLEESYETVTDMTKSVIFDKCDPDSSGLERSFQEMEKSFHALSDMSKSFESLHKLEEKLESKEESFTGFIHKIERGLDEAAAQRQELKSPPKDSGKSTPEMEYLKAEGNDSLLSGKSSPALSDFALSGKSSPDDLKKTPSRDSLLSEKSSEKSESKQDNLEKVEAVTQFANKSELVLPEPEKKLSVSDVQISLEAGPSSKSSNEELHLSGKSTPDIADVERLKEMQETLKHEKHIPGCSTPPTVPVSPIVKEENRNEVKKDSEEEDAGSPTSVTSQLAHSRSSSHYDFDDDRIGTRVDPMHTSFYGALPDDDEEDFEKAVKEHKDKRGEDLPSYLYEITKAKFTKKDPFDSWGKPLGLPSPAPPSDNRGTPKKERKLPAAVSAKNKLNDDKKRSESPLKYRNKKINPIYVDLTYVPHHGNSHYSYVDFFRRIRARYYVFSGVEPSKEVYNALLEAKQTWEDKELEVTIIPTYDTDILGYWVAENEEALTKCKIDLSPSASRCTINLQDHETSCSAYRLEF